MKLITLYGLKKFLDNKADTQHDAMLNTYIDGVSDMIQNHLNRYLEKAEYTHYFEADGKRRKFYLPAYPVDLTEDLVLKLDGSEQTINEDFYVRENDGLIHFYIPPYYIHPKDIEVTWTGGYELIDDSSDDDGSLDVPGTIKLAAYMQCAYMFRRRNDTGIMSMTLPDGSIRKGRSNSNAATKLLPEVTSMLLSYRRNPGDY